MRRRRHRQRRRAGHRHIGPRHPTETHRGRAIHETRPGNRHRRPTRHWTLLRVQVRNRRRAEHRERHRTRGAGGVGAVGLGRADGVLPHSQRRFRCARPGPVTLDGSRADLSAALRHRHRVTWVAGPRDRRGTGGHGAGVPRCRDARGSQRPRVRPDGDLGEVGCRQGVTEEGDVQGADLEGVSDRLLVVRRQGDCGRQD